MVIWLLEAVKWTLLACIIIVPIILEYLEMQRNNQTLTEWIAQNPKKVFILGLIILIVCFSLSFGWKTEITTVNNFANNITVPNLTLGGGS